MHVNCTDRCEVEVLIVTLAVQLQQELERLSS